MDLEALGKMMNEATALEGKLRAAVKKGQDIQSKVEVLNKELNRLEGLKSTKADAVKQLDDLALEEKGIRKQLKERLDVLASENVELPFNKPDSGGVVRL